MKLLFAVFVSFFSAPVFAQVYPPAGYPQDYFRDPLGIPMSLAANFGELRPNHYHMGLDIRTQHRENLPVYAAAEGYVTRIEVEPAGFGQAIYIRHPNGYTTVYGHLNHFFPVLEAYVRAQQYRQQSWQVSLKIPEGLFPVKKGQFIAFSGNTGGSQGPHLHFEIRRTAGDINLNPLLFGLPVPDRTPPTMLRLAWYDRTSSIYEQSPHLIQVHKNREGAQVTGKSAVVAGKGPVTAGWSIPGSLLVVPTNRISFALSAFDTQSGSANPNGIYEGVLFVDEGPVIGFRMDSISYNDTRNINAHIDYKTREMGGPFLQQLFFLQGYPSPSIYWHPTDGVLRLEAGHIYAVRIEVKDTYENTSSLVFRVEYRPGAAVGDRAAGIDGTGKKFYPGMVDGIETDGCSFYLGEKSLYDSVIIGSTVAGYPGSGLSLPDGLSPVYAIGAPWIPLLDPVLVRLRSAVEPDSSLARSDSPETFPRSKIVMVCFHGSQRDVQRPEWQGDWASARFREFGNFQLVGDTVAPVIVPVGALEGADLSHSARIAFNIKDNLGVLRNFRAELDDAWLCFTNDKGLAYIYTFDEHCPPGPHVLKVTVEDAAGNRTAAKYHFTR